MPRAMWEASSAGGPMIGLPLDSPQATGTADASFRATWAWCWQRRKYLPGGLPTAFGFPTAAGTTFPFLLGSLTLSDAGVASASGPVSTDLQR